MVQVLHGLEYPQDGNLLVGHQGMDDAGVYRLSPELALVQTLDFFPPVVDDPYQYGRIAAANSLSDVYAMGGRPITAMQIVGFPKDEAPMELLRDIFRGAADALREAECSMVGGHSVVDSEIKFGLSVTGTVHPEHVLSNDGAREGDRLYLTKPIGMGVITTAQKKNKVDEDTVAAACEIMGRLNRAAAEAAGEVPGVHAATDITGYGLMGHAAEMARGSGLRIRLDSAAVPFTARALELAGKGILSGGSARTRQFLDGQFAFADGVDEHLQAVMFDAETSGGLLFAVAVDEAPRLEEELRRREVPVHCVGETAAGAGPLLEVR